MGITAEQALSVAKVYTYNTVIGAGAVKGKNCTIESITPITGGNRITFKWTLDDDTEQTSTLDVMDGEKGENGDNGFSPIIVEDPGNTDEIYRLDITDATHTIVTPNLKGGGSGGTTNYDTLDNRPQINGVTLTGDKSTSDLGITIPTKTSDLTNDSNFITNAVNNLLNYYLKTEIYSKTEVDNIISAVQNSRFEVVNTLPTTDIHTNVIYLVPKSGSSTSNVKKEYINLDGTSAGWELIGDTEIDLSNYVTTTDLNTALANYVTTANLASALANYVSSISVNGVSQTISNSAVNLNVADNLITEAQWTTLSILWAV